MLFDLRSRGRRTTVRVVYGGIAIIFAVRVRRRRRGHGFGGNFNVGELFGGAGSSKTYGRSAEG